jgi:hypothetical protein
MTSHVPHLHEQHDSHARHDRQANSHAEGVLSALAEATPQVITDQAAGGGQQQQQMLHALAEHAEHEGDMWRRHMQ